MLKWNYKGTSSKEARYKRSHFVWLHSCEMSWESIEKESCCRGWGADREMGSDCLMNMRFLSGWWKICKIKSWQWLHNCENTKNHRIVYFKRVNFMVNELYFDLKKMHCRSYVGVCKPLFPSPTSPPEKAQESIQVYDLEVAQKPVLPGRPWGNEAGALCQKSSLTGCSVASRVFANLSYRQAKHTLDCRKQMSSGVHVMA